MILSFFLSPSLSLSLSLSPLLQHGIAESEGADPKHSLFTHAISHAGKIVSVQALECKQAVFVFVSPERLRKLSKEW